MSDKFDEYFHVLDTETREVEAVRNPITMFKKVILKTMPNGAPQHMHNLKSRKMNFLKLFSNY